MKLSNREMNDFIWMSLRYCIGRKTGAAIGHADTIGKVIYNNPKSFSEDSKQAIVNDIYREILNVMRWNKFIDLDGSGYWDVYSFFLIEASKCETPENCKFYINLTTKTLVDCQQAKDIKSYEWERFDSDYIDLIPWIKLANALNPNCHKLVYAEWTDDKGEKHSETETCISYAERDGNGKYFEAYVPVKTIMASINTGYIVPEYITKVEDL